MNDQPLTLSLTVTPRRVLQVTLAVWAILAGMHFLLITIRPALGYGHQMWGLVREFNLAEESNITTWWSAALLAAAGILMLIIAFEARRGGRPFVRHWGILGCGMLYLSLDEAARIHETVIGTIWIAFAGRGTGIFYYAWYLPIIPVVAVVIIAFIPFLKRLPSQTARWLIAAGVIYLGGSLGVEMIEASLSFNERWVMVGIAQLIEESFEILGVTIACWQLLGYIALTRSQSVGLVGNQRLAA